MTTENKEKPRGVLVEDLSELKEGLENLSKLKPKNFKLNYALEYNIEKVSRGLKAYYRSLNAMREAYVKQDADGELITIQSGVDGRGMPIHRFKFNNPESKKKFKKEADALDATPFDEKMFKIKVSTLEAEKNPEIKMAQIGCILERDMKIDINVAV